ncbi:unnamed protein product [Albugo candida]|nr:unnamed protein product [Albugo candida]|eukprot:CCI50137.1 unnamed protein product [Albugo candida]
MGTALHVAVVSIAIYLAWQCLIQIQEIGSIGAFDPYEILGIPESASLAEIKRAYRKMSMKYHPDKNIHDAAAFVKTFARISKAYESLTDKTSMENYQKYGHPDGRQSILVNFAVLPSFVSEYYSIVLATFYFALFFGGIAWIVYKFSKRSRNCKHLSRRTLNRFQETLHERMSVYEVLDVVLSSSELIETSDKTQREIEARTRSKAVDKLLKKTDAAKIFPTEVFNRIKKHSQPLVREYLIAAYFLLRQSKSSTLSTPLWLEEKIRHLLICLPYLLEHFASVAAKASVKSGYQSVTLLRCLNLLSGFAQGSFLADEESLRSQKQRLGANPLPELELHDVSMSVLDEHDFRAGDWLTLKFVLTRKHMDSNASKAPLATTLYDSIDPKSPFRKEQIWFLVLEKATKRLYAAWKCSDLSATVPQEIGFQGPKLAGKYQLEIRAVCIAYLGVETAMTKNISVAAPK